MGSMGSAFSGYMGNCLKKWEPKQISAFATHSTGLKKKGDGNRLPENWGECDGCQWWPFAPVKYSDNLGLKACIFDNTGDGDFYKTSVYLSKEWPQLGNPSESHFASGGHRQVSWRRRLISTEPIANPHTSVSWSTHSTI